MSDWIKLIVVVVNYWIYCYYIFQKLSRDSPQVQLRFIKFCSNIDYNIEQDATSVVEIALAFHTFHTFSICFNISWFFPHQIARIYVESKESMAHLYTNWNICNYSLNSLRDRELSNVNWVELEKLGIISYVFPVMSRWIYFRWLYCKGMWWTPTI